MAVKILSVKQSVENNGLKALVHAPAGTGKTVLCATAQEPTLIISAEAGLLSLNRNSKDFETSPSFDPDKCSVVEVKTLEELSEVFDLLHDQVSKRDKEGNIIYTKDLDENGDKIPERSKEHMEYNWVALDSITEIAEVVLRNELSKSKDPRKAYGNLQQVVIALLKAFRDLPFYNVIMTCKQQRVTDDVTGVSSYVPMMPGAKLTQQIAYLFDEVWCLRVARDDDGEIFHYIQSVRDNQFEAKDRSGKLTEMEPPSLRMLWDKIYGNKKVSPITRKPAKNKKNSDEVVEAEPEIKAEA